MKMMQNFIVPNGGEIFLKKIEIEISFGRMTKIERNEHFFKRIEKNLQLIEPICFY